MEINENTELRSIFATKREKVTGRLIKLYNN
jgi:hypothetical protein